MLGEDWRGSLIAGIEKTRIDINELFSSADVDSYHLSAYGSCHNISMSRSFSSFDTLQTLNSDYKAHSIQAFGEAGYQLTWATFDIKPFVGLAYVQTRRNGFNEQTTNPLIDSTLNAERATIPNTFTTLGVHLEHQLELENAIQVRIHTTPAWRQCFW